MKKIVAMILLLSLCLSMWGCSSNAANTTPTKMSSRPQSSVSNQRPNNNSGNGNNASPSTKIDPNGVSSLEQFVEAYVDAQTCSITKEQYRKLFPESHWKETDIDQQYSVLEDNKPHWQQVIQKYGNNFNVSYKIVSKEVTYDGNKATYTPSENQKHISIYGVGIDKRTVYTVKISITLKGSAREDTQTAEISCIKIGNKWYADDYMTH